MFPAAQRLPDGPSVRPPAAHGPEPAPALPFPTLSSCRRGGGSLPVPVTPHVGRSRPGGFSSLRRLKPDSPSGQLLAPTLGAPFRSQGCACGRTRGGCERETWTHSPDPDADRPGRGARLEPGAAGGLLGSCHPPPPAAGGPAWGGGGLGVLLLVSFLVEFLLVGDHSAQRPRSFPEHGSS